MPPELSIVQVLTCRLDFGISSGGGCETGASIGAAPRWRPSSLTSSEFGVRLDMGNVLEVPTKASTTLLLTLLSTRSLLEICSLFAVRDRETDEICKVRIRLVSSGVESWRYRAWGLWHNEDFPKDSRKRKEPLLGPLYRFGDCACNRLRAA